MTDNETLVSTNQDVEMDDAAVQKAEDSLTGLRFRFVQTADKPARA